MFQTNKFPQPTQAVFLYIGSQHQPMQMLPSPSENTLNVTPVITQLFLEPSPVLTEGYLC